MIWIARLIAAAAAAVLLTLMWPSSAREPVIADQRPSPAYFARIDSLAAQGPERRIYFIGDSLTFHLDTSSLAPGSLNMGVSSDRAEWLRQRIKHYGFLKSASCAFLAIGVNDFDGARSPDEIADDVLAIADYLRAHGTLVLNAVLPVDENGDLGGEIPENANILRLNQRLSQWCRQTGNCTFADATTLMLDETGQLSDAYHTDGVHLTSAGYHVWRGVIAQSLQDAKCGGAS